MHVAAESEAAFPSDTAERIGNLVKYTANREIGRVAKKRVTFRRAACKQGRTFQTTPSKCKKWYNVIRNPKEGE